MPKHYPAELRRQTCERMLAGEAVKGLKVRVEKALGEKCERCWKYSPRVGASARHPTLCDRCVTVITART